MEVIIGFITLLLVILLVISVFILCCLCQMLKGVLSIISTQEKIFKLIRYKRSQEVLDFLNKKVDNSNG